MEAKHHIEKLGYNAHFKESPDVTDNFYRFRQKNPTGGDTYKTIPIGRQGDKAIIESSKIEPHVLGRDPATWGPHNAPKYHV